ncbi:lipopolysaccharide transport periplasmic protein LptA [Agitococcus lubricus]|uniref:Lipopolysaccharide export system protein LptA n=1 Tax=Agitococcus lubricus TaxID=1077255 RepID=A0A2T5IZF1_9GAMM|nr:lipopolysaccharide transport periplasmic protein LptA [Agitococcus lubricus]PTQ89427.1 lipopolysaccharide export system protein LptA [Agitococcus lubricus]
MWYRLASLCLCLSPLLANALPNDRDQPISIAANSASFNEKTGIATYTGNIEVQQGSLLIKADEIIATVDKQGTIISVVAKGKPARFQQQPATDKGIASAEAEEVNYQARDGLVQLKGNAKLQQDNSSFKSQQISYSLDKGEIEAKGDSKNRVQLVFPPPKKEDRKTKKLGEPPTSTGTQP